MKQVKNNSCSYLSLNGSQFYCYGFQIKNKEEIKIIINKLWKENKKAVHICYGAIFYENNLIVEKSDDDGEPKNSAGKRIVGAMKDNDLINSLLVVVRFKSKSMLGLGLLTRSYYNVCDLLLKENKNVIDYVDLIEKEIYFKDQKELNEIIKISKKENLEIIKIDNNTQKIILNIDKNKKYSI